MVSLTCRSIDLSRAKLDLVTCGCSSNRNSYAKWVYGSDNSRKNRARKLECNQRRRHYVSRCSALSAQTPESAVFDVVTQDSKSALDSKSNTSSPTLASSLLEVVAEDLQTLNKNLKSEMRKMSNAIVWVLCYSMCMNKAARSIETGVETPLKEASRPKTKTPKIIGAENPVLISAAEQIFGAGGKRLRPALVFLVSRATAELANLKELTPKHRRLAEVIEMIHTASLIHDDVIDDSSIRRGKKTIHQLYGTRVAILAGDFMFAQSSWYLANLENIEVIKLISQVIKDFASGEIKQASGLFDCDLTLEEYLMKSYYKTASLMAASAKCAAILTGVDIDVCEQMFEFGKNLGLSFQVVDDILDFTQSEEQLGKPAGNDLEKGNLTAPVIFALEKEPKLREIIDSEFMEDGSLNDAIELIIKCGGIARAQDLAKEKADLAIQSLKCLPFNEFRASLEGLVKYNLERID